jgi:alanine racemase
VEPFHRPTWVELSLDALHHNIEQFRRTLPSSMRIMAVVKANAYGHGAIGIATSAMQAGADYLAVAFLDEAIQLRHAGITAPILILGYTSPEEIELAAELDVTITAYSEEVLDAIKDRSDGPPLKIHIKLDTGMGRIGIVGEEAAVAFIDRALAIRGLSVEGLFTHYACADETDKTYTYEQHKRFDRIVHHYRDRGIEFPYLHAGNSATGIDTPELSYNMLRLGISMYGMYPSGEVDRSKIALRPVMAYKTKVIQVKTLPKDSAISYGATYHTSGEERIATIPVGYADGFSRMMSGKAEVLVRGVKVPVVGRICMDQCMINVTGVPDICVGDEVVLFGEQAGSRISAEDVASNLGTINYEITCMVNYRVPRVFVGDDGRRVQVVNLLS